MACKVRKTMKVILILLVVAVFVLAFMYMDLIKTVLSIEKLSDAPAYRASVYGHYALPEYLVQGADSNEALQNFCFKALKLEFLNPKAENFDHGCSGFYAQTPEGDYILALDYDTYPNQQLPLVIQTEDKTLGIANIGYFVKAKELNGLIDKISVGASPYLCVDGINEHGLGIGLATAVGSSGMKADDDRLVVVDFTIPTVVLNQAKDVEEAIACMSQITIPYSTHPSHFLIGDAKGNSAVIEWINGEMQVIQEKTPYQIFSNMVLYGVDDVDCNRYRAYEKRLKETNGIITEQGALELLKENTLGSHACFSVVYNLNQKTMLVTFHGDYENAYEIELQ